MEITIKGIDVITKEVKEQTSSGVIYVPKKWIGRNVKVILLEENQGEENDRRT